MSLRVILGRRANLLMEMPEATRLVELASPVLKPAQMAALAALTEPEFRTGTVRATWELPAEQSDAAAGQALRAAVDRLCHAAEDAVREGVRILIISDAGTDAYTLPIPALLAVGAVHHHLMRQGLRMSASLVCAAGELREVHHFAALIGYGANAVYPYLAYETIAEMVAEGRHSEGLTLAQAIGHFVKAVDKGLLKIMSKMGISTVDSYCGAQIFEALGIGEELLDVAFAGTPSVLGGVGFDVVARNAIICSQRAYPPVKTAKPPRLDSWGLYKSRRGGELHVWSPEVVHALHAVARATSPAESLEAHKRYAGLVNHMKLGPAPSARLPAHAPAHPAGAGGAGGAYPGSALAPRPCRTARSAPRRTRHWRSP